MLVATVLLVLFSLSNIATAQSTASSGEVTAVDGSITRTLVTDNSTMELNIWSWSVNGEPQITLHYFAVIVLAATMLCFVTIFFYRKRLVQIRFAYVIWVLLLGAMVFQGLYYFRMSEACVSQPTYGWVMVPSIANALTPISLILVWFAYRGIVADEALVRSADRLR